ncbi:Origin recognition complex subunit 5, partial [Podila epicladia]
MSHREQLHDAFPGRTKQINQILGFMGKPWVSTPPSLLINGNSSLGKTAVVKAVLSTTLAGKSPSRYAFLDCVECHTPRLIFEHAIYQFRNPPPTPARSLLKQPKADISTEQDSLDQGSGGRDEQEEESIPNKRRKATTTVGDTRKKQKTDATNNNEQVWDKCENINEFVEWCRKICDQDDTDDSKNTSMDVGRPVGKKDTRYLVLDRAERLRDTAPSLIPVLMRLQELTGCNICVILITQIVWEKFRSKTGG